MGTWLYENWYWLCGVGCKNVKYSGLSTLTFSIQYRNFYCFRVGVFFFIVMNQVFGNLSSVELFIKERAIFMWVSNVLFMKWCIINIWISKVFLSCIIYNNNNKYVYSIEFHIVFKSTSIYGEEIVTEIKFSVTF